MIIILVLRIKIVIYNSIQFYKVINLYI